MSMLSNGSLKSHNQQFFHEGAVEILENGLKLRGR